MKLEIACFNYESAIVASQSGADRIELCAGFEVGGTTPDIALLRRLKSEVEIPIYVMIRPRGGDFLYSDTEFAQMKSAISQFKTWADGFVFGILTQGNQVDVKRNSELVKTAGKPCTFHRAFDDVSDFSSALDAVICCGFSTILTSAGIRNAIGNLEALLKLVKSADGKITVMPGGGVRSSNIGIIETSGAQWFHSAAIVDGSQYTDRSEIEKMKKAAKS
ncbi:copper homeostasis protein CutC [Flavobacterium selenitireducens]|uniref:copper homeostasis protein CutC n=1 Tax=Flavobacterium selenitireducens TaxID=2722704 RepID=UPI00168B7158|nr:copper homeostasis protein CutC [Flavobacterium selenitireducens]MBD3583186.1 copper homeostasis protein CutC [Flavobacterium selenitireducens]